MIIEDCADKKLKHKKINYVYQIISKSFELNELLKIIAELGNERTSQEVLQ